MTDAYEDINRLSLQNLSENEIGVMLKTEINPVGEHCQLILIDRRTGKKYVVKAEYVKVNNRL